MKCIFTGQETKNKTRNLPVSREGRKVMRERQLIMAEAKLEEHHKFIESLNEKGQFSDPLIAQTTVKDFMPSITEVLQEQVRQNNLEE